MDPVITPALLAKAAAPAASRFAVNNAGKLTRVRRAAAAAAKKATAAGAPVAAKTLRKWLSRADTAHLLRQCTERSLEQAASQLAYVMPGRDVEERGKNALVVLRLVMDEYVRFGTPTEAALITGEWGRQTTVEDGAKTRKEFGALRGEVVSRLDARSDFGESLRSLSPWSAQEARHLLNVWPPVDKAVGILTSVNGPRSSVLQQWAEQEPAWMQDAPAEAFSWLGQLAAEYQARPAAQEFIERCIREGGFPRDFLLVRAAMQTGTDTDADEAAQSYLVVHQDGTSPVLNALRALWDRNWADGLEQLGRWDPHDALARTFKAQLEAQALVGANRYGEALARLRTVDEAGVFSGITLRLASTLLQRAVHGPISSRVADAQEALAVAIRARNSRRPWHGDSAEPVVLAVQAAVLCGDLSTAWSLTQPSPEGQATPREAEDSRLQEQTALVAALSGRTHVAESLLPGITSTFARTRIKALIAELRGEGNSETQQVQNLWQEAWEAASNDQEQLAAAMGLAESEAEIPDLGHLRAAFPDAVNEIELLSRALRDGSGDALALLRANVTQSPGIVVKLAERYHRGGDGTLAAQTLKDGADRWHDVRLMTMAAGLFQEAGEHARAQECAEAALRMAGAKWPGQSRMYALLVEVEWAQGRIDRATDAATTLLDLDPLDSDARWALIKCFTARAQAESAWQTLTDLGDPLDPRSRDEAALWVGLGARFSSDPQFTGRALALMQRWPEDEELLGRLLSALHMRASKEILSGEDGIRLRSATDDYIQRFPDSTVFRAVALGPPDDPLQNVADELRRAHESAPQAKDIVDKVAQGVLPAGMLTLAAGVTYAEVCLRRAAERPVVHAVDIPQVPAEVQAVQVARTSRTVLDTTAAAALALLDAKVAEQLIGYSQSVVTTDQLLADALEAKESIVLRSDLSLVWDENRADVAVHSSTPEQLAALRTTATRLAEIMQSTARVSRPELRALPSLRNDGHATTWLTALDYAKENNLVLWCDDRILRALAHSEGVATFGTVTLLDVCLQSGLLRAQEHVVIKAELLRNYFVDFPFSADLYRAAAQADGWRAKGVSSAISRPSAWSAPDAATAFVLDAAAKTIGTQPDEASMWLSCAYAGLHRATLPSHQSRNLEVFSWQVLTQPWLSTSTLPFVLTGLRGGITAVAGTDAPLRAALAQYYGVLVSQLGHIAAASALMALFALTDENDKSIAARIVLTHPDQ
ncbi:hypothetical protein [Streptomyces sp. NPDC088910]|uniref:PIN domain-containing protein n=1 Tax=Streptomyces sp. NPDC088910 TaxID=3365911 RepID=UPI0037F669BB